MKTMYQEKFLSQTPAAIRARERRAAAREQKNASPVVESAPVKNVEPLPSVATKPARINRFDQLRELLKTPRSEVDLLLALDIKAGYLKTLLSDVQNPRYSHGPAIVLSKTSAGEFYYTDVR